jgi:hypothetical protein
MQKIFVMYKLKPGVTIEQYREWSREVDQRITPGQPGVIRFEVYAIEGHDGDGEPAVHVVEDIEVDSWEAWEETVAGDGMAYIRETFPLLADESSATAIYGSRIAPTLPDGARPPLPASLAG